MTKGLLTATKTAVLNNPAEKLWTITNYDDEGWSIQTYKQHYYKGWATPYNYDVITTTYDFTCKVTTTTHKHYIKVNQNTEAATLALTIAERNIYDHMGRKLKNWQTITQGSTITPRTLIAKLDYNEAGQLIKKNLHSTDSLSFLQSIAYAYNERG